MFKRRYNTFNTIQVEIHMVYEVTWTIAATWVLLPLMMWFPPEYSTIAPVPPSSSSYTFSYTYSLLAQLMPWWRGPMLGAIQTTKSIIMTLFPIPNIEYFSYFTPWFVSMFANTGPPDGPTSVSAVASFDRAVIIRTHTLCYTAVVDGLKWRVAPQWNEWWSRHKVHKDLRTIKICKLWIEKKRRENNM